MPLVRSRCERRRRCRSGVGDPRRDRTRIAEGPGHRRGRSTVAGPAGRFARTTSASTRCTPAIPGLAHTVIAQGDGALLQAKVGVRRAPLVLPRCEELDDRPVDCGHRPPTPVAGEVTAARPAQRGRPPPVVEHGDGQTAPGADTAGVVESTPRHVRSAKTKSTPWSGPSASLTASMIRPCSVGGAAQACESVSTLHLRR